MDKDVFLILGASSDLGCAVIQDLKNCIVLAHYHTGIDKLKRLENLNDVTLIPIQADLSDETSLQQLMTTIKSHCLHPTKILHFAAQKFKYTRFKEMDWQETAFDFNLQVKSIALLLKGFLPLMSGAKNGKVIFVLSSVTQGTPPKMLSSYVMIKYALLGLMKSLAVEYAEKNIQINAVSPSMIETSFLSNLPEKLVELNAENHPLKRNALVQDIVPIIHFLLSPKANFMTGVNIPVTGGLNIS